jgi:hypothetical protein
MQKRNEERKEVKKKKRKERGEGRSTYQKLWKSEL